MRTPCSITRPSRVLASVLGIGLAAGAASAPAIGLAASAGPAPTNRLAAGAAAAPIQRTPAPPNSASAIDRVARVKSALESERQRLHIPGMAVAVVEDDRVVLLAGLGVRSLETREPVDAGTVFPIGSCTKAFTAMAAVISQEDGKLSLDDSPRVHLPWFHMADPEADQLVTLRDMLSHRSGLRAYADLAAEPAVLSRLEYVRAATSARPVARLRERFQYSNAMYTAVGEIVAKAQGSSWEQVIARRIFDPLGMMSSRALASDLPQVRDRAVGYDDSSHSGHWRPVPPPASLNALAPAGSIASSAADMARWLRFLLAEGSIDGNRVVSVAGIHEVMTPHTQYKGPIWYGLGWVLYDWNHHRVVEHNGGSSGISALVSMIPERRVGFVLLVNTTPTSLTGITQAGKILWPILLGEHEAAPKPPTRVVAAATDTTALDTLDLPSTRELLTRMLAAAGGARNLRRHPTLEQRSRKRYLNQGIEADVRTLWQAPNRLAVEEAWTAVGKSIGRVRTYVDGEEAGQETTFGQNAVYSGSELERARQTAAVDWLAEPNRVFPRLRLLGRRRVAVEDAFVLQAGQQVGDSTLFTVSARTYLIVRKSSAGADETYSDFRNVGGVVRPFHVAIEDELGESDVVVSDVRFDAPIPATAFAPRTLVAGWGGRVVAGSR